jgi:two-component system cell cycle response regulator DivK
MPNILVVEDDCMNMRLAQYILEVQGYTVLKAATAQEALEQAESTLPDLILMDVHLPDMDGTTVVRLLRENTTTRDITIVALTAYAMKGDRERILETGCNGYISKPIDVRDFTNTVRGFLKNLGEKK